MKCTEIIRKLMDDKRLTQKTLSEILEYKNQSGVSQALKGDMKSSTFIRFLNVLGYDLVVKNRETGEEIEVTVWKE